MKKILLAALLFPSSAVAGELPLWTRFYGGLNVGYGFGTNESVTNSGVSGPALTGLIGLGVTSANNSGGNVSQSGVVAGGQVGYNRQITPVFVVGVEADIQGSGINGSGNTLGIGQRSSGTTLIGYAVSNRVNVGISSLGTVRGRVGYLLAPSVLIYGTGGLAYGEKSLTTSPQEAFFQNTSAGNFMAPYGASWTQASATNFVSGWTAGGGAEWMVSQNWSVKGEALYYDLGGLSVNNQSIRADGIPAYAASAMNTKVSYQGVIARAGVNYHFDWFK